MSLKHQAAENLAKRRAIKWIMAAMEIWMQEGYDTHFDASMRFIINAVRAELQPLGT